jgi:hypothetical protein
MEESHTNEQSPKIVSEMELRAKRSKISCVRARRREREQPDIFARGRRRSGLKG